MIFNFLANRSARRLRVTLAAAMLLSGAVVEAKGAADSALPNEILVQLRSTAALDPLLSTYQLGVVSQFGARPIYRLKVLGLADADATIEALLTNPSVLNAEPNFIHQAPEARRSSSWTIGTPGTYFAQWAPAAMRLSEAHRLSTGAGVRIAVLDTGADSQHPALADKLVPGFNFVDNNANTEEAGNWITNAGYGHGTHVAGLVAMVAPAAKIMPLRVLDANGAGNAWVLAEAMLYAVDPDRNPATNDGVQVINMSLGSTSRTHILDTVAKLAACDIAPVIIDPLDDLADPSYNGDRSRCNAFSGAVIVAAAGNDGSKDIRQYPAAEGAYGLIAVTSSSVSKQLSPFSNFGSWVHVAAPGEGITSAIPGGVYGTWSGTSMASPLTAGTVALVRAANPTMSPKDVARRVIRVSANLCGTNLRQIDATAALQNVTPADTTCP
jgi:subtilisin family serine protease